MSSNSQVLNNGQQATTNYDLAKIFIFNNRFAQASFTNSQYDPTETMLAGTIMGRIAGTNNIVPWISTATDGSQYPIGILANDVVVNDGATVTLNYCVSGDIAKDQIVFWKTTDTFATVVSGRTLYDRLGSDSVGIKIVDNTEMTAFDNQ